MTEITLSVVIEKALAEPDFRMSLLGDWEKTINEAGLVLKEDDREKLQELINQTQAAIEIIFSKALSEGVTRANGNCWVLE